MLLALLLQLDVDREIRRLGAEDVADRDAAAARLVEAGEPAVEALQRALDDPDPEIAARAAAILRTIRPSRLDAFFADVKEAVAARADPGERIDALLKEARALNDDCEKAAGSSSGPDIFAGVAWLKGSRDGFAGESASGERVLSTVGEVSSVSGCIIIVDGDFAATAVDTSVIIATGAISVTSATQCVLIAGGGVSGVQVITESVIVSPGAVTGQYVLESTVLAGKGATPQLLYECVLVNSDGSSSAEYGVGPPKRVDSDAVKAWFEPRIRR